MKNEKLALVALVVVVLLALTAFIVINFGGDLFKEAVIIEESDCCDVNYIGKYASNDTIFESSYQYPENKSGGVPLNIFVSFDLEEYPPEGYETYYSGMIESFMNGLIGLKEGETATIGPIAPEDAYGGKKLGIGDTFYTTNLAYGLNQTVEVTNLDQDILSLSWVNYDTLGNFTMPQMYFKNLSSIDPNEMISYVPPHYLWENSSEVISTSDDEIVIKTKPASHNFSFEEIKQYQYNATTGVLFIFPNATEATWDNDTVTITSNPTVGSEYPFTLEYYGETLDIIFTIENVTDSKINLSVTMQGYDEKQYQLVDKVYTFNRTITMPLSYNDIPMMYAEMILIEDLQNQGYSLDKLAGEELLFEVTIEKVYKTSQDQEES